MKDLIGIIPIVLLQFNIQIKIYYINFILWSTILFKLFSFKEIVERLE
jgi:hypothetical protein